jgi:hypothetical protein
LMAMEPWILLDGFILLNNDKKILNPLARKSK